VKGQGGGLAEKGKKLRINNFEVYQKIALRIGASTLYCGKPDPKGNAHPSPKGERSEAK